MVDVREVMTALHTWYPPEIAEPWDSVGVIAGKWDWPVNRVLVSVDIDSEVLAEAVAKGADLVLSHHPLALPRQGGPGFSYKQRLAQRAVSQGIALANAHTNADHANPGVSDALALALELTELRPLVALPQDPALGTGRIGQLPAPMALGEFAAHVAARVPRARVRVAGSSAVAVHRVALVAGAGDSCLEAARLSGVDVFVTSDLRHHPVAEHLEQGGCPVVDVNHQAAEAMWLPLLAERLQSIGLTAMVSEVDTAHWHF